MANYIWFTIFPIFSHLSGSEWLILPDSQLFWSFPTKVAQNDWEWPILHGQNKILWYKGISMKDHPSTWQLCPKPYGFLVTGFWVRHDILVLAPSIPKLQLFQSFPTEVAQNGSILPDSQLFWSFPTKVAQNDWEWPILHGQNLKWLWYKGISMKLFQSFTWTAVP